MSSPLITIEDNPLEKDIRVLWDGIGEYNFSQTGLKGQAILVFLREAHTAGQILVGCTFVYSGSKKISVKGDRAPPPTGNRS